MPGILGPQRDRDLPPHSEPYNVTWRVSFLVHLPEALSGSDETRRNWIADHAIRSVATPAGLVATPANAPEYPLARHLASIDIEVTAANASEAIAFAKDDLIDPDMQWNVRLHDRMLLPRSMPGCTL